MKGNRLIVNLSSQEAEIAVLSKNQQVESLEILVSGISKGNIIDNDSFVESFKDPKFIRIINTYNFEDIIVGISPSKISTITQKNTIFDSLPRLRSGRWVSIGRLDINTSGLILFTNDGALANKLMHPSSNIEREYVARVHGNVTDNIIENLVEGVDLEDGFAKFTDVQGGRKGNTNQWFAMVIMEGRTREVRRLWESQGLEISRLKRVRYGNLFLPAHLKQGAFKELTKGEVNALERL